jgi:hypothetical protein
VQDSNQTQKKNNDKKKKKKKKKKKERKKKKECLRVAKESTVKDLVVIFEFTRT